ncbi:MAG: Ig-like domain-containing protein [Anaerolineae bacterium]|nr:Ig-like domain-containing protein [Anaerolineae bacterium]
MRWQRRYRVTQSGEYMLRLRFAGGARLFINDVEQTPRNDLAKPYRTVGAVATQPWSVNSTLRSHYYTYTFSSGVNYDIRVEYFHTTAAQSGDGRIEFSIAERSSIARTSPLPETYGNFHRTSLILNGYLEIPAGKVGNVRYDERFSFTDQDYGKVYYSLDEGFTWNEVVPLRRSNNNPQGGGWSVGSLQDWVGSSFLILSPSGDRFTEPQRVLIKFELDSRINPAVDDGWWIDNFGFLASESIANTAPIFTSATINTETNRQGSAVPFVIDQPGDTHTFEIVTQPPRGVAGVSVGGSQLTYQPPSEWTGTVTFTYRAIDQGGLSRVGTAVVNVRPYFVRGVNLGPWNSSQTPEVTINGNDWNNIQTGSVWGSSTSDSFNGSLAITPPQDTNTTTMLRSCIRANADANAQIGIDNVPTGIYSVYVWTVEHSATPQTFDLHYGWDPNVRWVNNHTGPQGTFMRHGPLNIVHTGGAIPIRFPGDGTNRRGCIAGVEVWRGADPSAWSSGDIGWTLGGSLINGKGSTSALGPSSFRVTASGVDIWNNADGFRYTWRYEMGNAEIIARVTFEAISSSNWNKAGLMIRGGPNRAQAHASIFLANPNGGNTAGRVSFQRRLWWGNNSESNTTGDVIPAILNNPVWLRLVKQGTNYSGFYSLDGTNWIQVGSTITIDGGNIFDSDFMIGLAVTSHQDGEFATAVFDNVQIIPR